MNRGAIVGRPLTRTRSLPSIQSLVAQSMRPTAHRNLNTSILCLLLLLCLGGGVALALDPARDLSEFNGLLWLTENGLPQNTVHSIIQAKDGYVWIATEEGLARFDGIKFTIFDKQNTPELKSNDIRVLLEDRRGGPSSGANDGHVRLPGANLTPITSPRRLAVDLT